MAPSSGKNVPQFSTSFPFVRLPVLLWVKVMVFLDFFAVALVVPILSSYFRDAGVESRLYGLMSSAYSIAQLGGGVVLGFLSDSISKRSILLLSFVGSAVSYLLVGCTSNVYLLFFSRLLVGSVKQTMSTTSLIVSQVTFNEVAMFKQEQMDGVYRTTDHDGGDGSRTNAQEHRTKELAQISAVSTACFIFGPSLGGLMYKTDKRLPAVAACVLFGINSFVCCFLLQTTDELLLSSTLPPCEGTDREIDKVSQAKVLNSSAGNKDKYVQSGVTESTGPVSDKNGGNNTAREAELWSISTRNVTAFVPRYTNNAVERLRSSIRDVMQHWNQFGSHRLFYIIVVRLALLLIQSSISPRNVLNYYEDRFGVETYQLGFISSLLSIMSIISEAFIVAPALRCMHWFGRGEVSAQLLCLFLLVITNSLESLVPSLHTYIAYSLIPATIASTVLNSVVRSSFINSVPAEHLGKVWGLFNVAVTFIGVVAPLYGSQVFSVFSSSPHHQDIVPEESSNWWWGSAAQMKGFVGAAHYGILLAVATWYLSYMKAYSFRNKDQASIPLKTKKEQ